MNDSLAQELLAQITEWPTEQLTDERKNLQLLSEYKYDEYQQFEPGMRFIESLALWLRQFNDMESRAIAYNFIKNKVIFVSTAELNHLIRITYPDFIRRYLIEQIAPELGVEDYLLTKIVDDTRFQVLERQCLFLGLSDGARVDVLRRFSALKHEQVHPTYSVAGEKVNDYLREMRHDIETITQNPSTAKYRFIFLIDDFSASGKSYLRKEGGNLKGKIYSFYRQMKANGPITKLCDDNVKICVVLYIATQRATNYIQQTASEAGIPITVIPILELDDSTSMAEEDLGEFASLVKEKLDKDSILTDSYRKGKHDKPHMGFDECGLSVVLSHNCPNNSLPILWHKSEQTGARALFTRFQRHS